MDTQRRRLVVVRHAKSAWPAGVPDRKRPLAPRGIGDAPRMGALIADRVGPIDRALVSPAVRAQQTWELLAAELGSQPDVVVDDRIYDEWGGRMLEVVRGLPDDVTTGLLVGHEPGVSRLVLALADRANETDRDRIMRKFPTCAVAVLGTDGSWYDAAAGSATLEWFRTPRG